MSTSAADRDGLLRRLVEGDKQALAALLSAHRERLWQMISFRLDHRLLGRVDPDDVLQEAYLDAAERIQHFNHDHSGSFFIWLRMIVVQTIANVHRRHLDAQMRDAKREISIHAGKRATAESTSLALQLLGHLTSPSQVAMRAEAADQIQQVVSEMDPIDREVLTLRHFEQLTNTEVAEVLNIQKKAASIRYIRAIKKLKVKLTNMPNVPLGPNTD